MHLMVLGNDSLPLGAMERPNLRRQERERHHDAMNGQSDDGLACSSLFGVSSVGLCICLPGRSYGFQTCC